MKRPLPNTYWVVEGRLLAGEHPSGRTPAETRKRVAKLLEAGIDSFVDLTETGEREAYRDLLPREVAYYHRPFPDHGVPSDVAAMHEVLAVLRSALASGRNVYVHCRAGIGRTGMTVACHLCESGGIGGPESLTRLNELWKQNARSASWPQVPETDAQEAFVRAFRPALATVGAAAPTSTTSSRLRALGPMDRDERARGALLGLAVGDALAVGVADAAPGTPASGHYLGGGPDGLPPGAWTDDTAMALCLADSLIACGGTDTRDQAERYLHWLRDGRRSATGVAAGVRPELRRTLALAAARRSALSGSHDPNLLDSEPLARAAPPAIYFIDDLAAATDAAADAARVSHQAPVLVDACRLFCAMLHAALNGVDRPGLLGLHRDWQDLLRPEVMAVAQGWSGGGRRGRVRGAILQTLDAAVRAFAGAQDFRHGLGTLLAGHLADPDVASAAYGQLAGAFFGERGIPSSLREGLVDAAVIAGIADALLPSGALAESSPQGLLSR